MQIEINLFATLAAFKPDQNNKGSWTAEFDNGLTVGEILSRLRVPPEKVKIVFINGVHATLETALQDGDRLGVFPPVGGG